MSTDAITAATAVPAVPATDRPISTPAFGQAARAHACAWERHAGYLPSGTRNQLTRWFEPAQVSVREGRGGKKFHYLSWSAVEQRLNTVLGFGWSWEIKQQTCEPTAVPGADGTERSGYLAGTVGSLVVEHQAEDGSWRRSARDASDAHFSEDAGDARKSSASGALVKAAALHGIGFELMSDDWRQLYDWGRGQLPAATVGTLKKQLVTDADAYLAATGREVPTDRDELVAVLTEYASFVGREIRDEAELDHKPLLLGLVFDGGATRLRYR